MGEEEIQTSLEDTLLQILNQDKTKLEDTLSIVFEPLSIYRVRPVTRCVETMPGHTDSVLHVSYSPDGTKLASGGGDMTVRFWNVLTSMPIHTCIGHKHHVLCTAWSPDGDSFVSADRCGEIKVWDPVTGKQKGRDMKSHSSFVTSISFKPFHLDVSCSFFASSSKDKTIVIWNLQSNQSLTTLYGHTDSVECVKWGGNGLLYSCSRDRTIKVWGEEDGSHFKLVRTLTGHAHRINSIALNCDFVLRTGPFRLGHFTQVASDISSRIEELQQISLDKYNAIVGADGETLVSCSDDFTLFMWKPQLGKIPVTRMTGDLSLLLLL